MAYNAEGQPRDLVKALAYFEFAAARQYNEAKTLTAKIRPTLSAAQQQQADDLLVQLEQQVKVKPRTPVELATVQDDMREPVRRAEPKYPVKAAKMGMFGSVTMRLLINEQGDVDAVDVLNAYPQGLFENSAISALKRWKYKPGDRKTIGRVMLTFSLGSVDHKKVERILSENKLFEYSVLGSPQHQNALANLLQLVRTNSDFTQFVDKSLPPAVGPLNKDFVAKASVVTTDLLLPADYNLNAFVTLNDQGVVTAVHDNNAQYLQQINAALLNRQLTKADVPAGFYRLSAYDKKHTRLLTAQRIPQTYTDEYWLDHAARSGNLDAQRALAALRQEWEMYLLEQQDPVVQSWAGTRLVLDGKKAEGEKLLDAAIAKGHATAKELKAAL
jgi:TonB family protein